VQIHPSQSQLPQQQQQPQQSPVNVVLNPNAAARTIHGVQTHEMTIPNDLIGCIIGRGGQKISEIR